MAEEENKKESAGEEAKQEAPKINYQFKQESASFPLCFRDLMNGIHDVQIRIHETYNISAERSRELFSQIKEPKQCDNVAEWINATIDIEVQSLNESLFLIHAACNMGYRHYIEQHLRIEMLQQIARESQEFGKRFEAMAIKDPSIVERTFGPSFKKDPRDLPEIKKPDPKDLPN